MKRGRPIYSYTEAIARMDLLQGSNGSIEIRMDFKIYLRSNTSKFSSIRLKCFGCRNNKNSQYSNGNRFANTSALKRLLIRFIVLPQEAFSYNHENILFCRKKFMIDLRSDTVTKPGKEMLEAMLQASVGDDVFEEDPTVHLLEKKMSAMFGMENALFFPSGVMCNQVAIKCHTQPMDEVICDAMSHIYNSENGAWAMHSGVSIRLLHGDRGRFGAKEVEQNINPTTDWQPRTSLVCLENTVNKGGGSIWNFKEIEAIQALTKKHELKLHLDGARLFNALAETSETTADYGKIFDSISICFSKGLGTPVGSVLLGTSEFIKRARKWRKAMGGGMRQVGLLAAACLYALENNLPKLKQDHQRAKALGEVMEQTNVCKRLFPVESNIVLFELKDHLSPVQFIETLRSKNILVVPFGGATIRMVTHLDFDDNMLEYTLKVLKEF